MQVQPSGTPVALAVQPPSAASRTPLETGAQGTAAVQDERALVSESQQTKSSQDKMPSVQEATKRLQDFVSAVRDDIQFSVDKDSGETVV